MTQNIDPTRIQLVDPSEERVKELSLRLPDATRIGDTLRVGDGSYGEMYLKVFKQPLNDLDGLVSEVLKMCSIFKLKKRRKWL